MISKQLSAMVAIMFFKIRAEFSQASSTSYVVSFCSPRNNNKGDIRTF